MVTVLLLRFLFGVLIGSPRVTHLSCVCGHPKDVHADADYTGLTWCTGDCGCSYYQPHDPQKWWQSWNA